MLLRFLEGRKAKTNAENEGTEADTGESDDDSDVVMDDGDDDADDEPAEDGELCKTL
jgi:hypothetical protein